MEEGEITSNSSTLLNFFSNIKPLLAYFENNPIEPQESVTKRFPKYLKDPKLFEYQIQEPFFRKSILTQLKLMILSAKTPVKNQQNFGPFSDSDKKALKKHEDYLTFLLKRYKLTGNKKGFHDAINKALKMERQWIEWKNHGCKPFEMSLNQEKRENFGNGREVIERDMKAKVKMEKDVGRWLRTNVDYTHLDALDSTNLAVRF